MLKSKKCRGAVVRPLAECHEAVAPIAHAVAVSPRGVVDLVEALADGVPVYRADDGVYLISLPSLLARAGIARMRADALAEGAA